MKGSFRLLCCLGLALILPIEVWAKRPVVSMSSPPDGVLIRANIPIFGTAYVPNDPDGLQSWRLEYGPGRAPKEWNVIKESTDPVPFDPWAAGQIKFDPNWGAHGNLTDWSVGLTSYRYATWRNNLNGIYTLRLTAVAKTGEQTQITRNIIVGEAILRTQGGTASSTDLKCHVLFQPFSFDGFMSQVVAVVRQVSSNDENVDGLTGSEETGPNADRIYQRVPSDLKLLSPIYRIYPNGMIIDPPAEVQMECTDLPPNDGTSQISPPLIYLWNPVAIKWEPFATSWNNNVGIAKVTHFPEYETYAAVFSRSQLLPQIAISWNPTTALSGRWQGRTEPFATLSVTAPSGKVVSTTADENGVLSLPYLLDPGSNIYKLDLAPVSGAAFGSSLQVIQKTDNAVASVAPRLSLSGPPIIAPGNHLYLLCEDDSLPKTKILQRRSLLATFRDSLFKNQFNVEMMEAIPGSGQFACSLDPSDPKNPYGKQLAEFPHHSILVISVGSASIQVTTEAHDKPNLVSLTSPSHPSNLYLSSDGMLSALKTPSLHDQAQIKLLDGAVQLSGSSDKPSARLVYWPTDGFSPKSWSFIGFSYKLYQPSKWQLLISGSGKIQSFLFGATDSWFAPYAATDPLISDGQWHRWQASLQPSPFDTVDHVFFGSWLKSAFLRADPAFTNGFDDVLNVRDLWIGQSYLDRAVEMDWDFHDASDLDSVTWWIDTTPDATGPSSDSTNPTGVVPGASSNVGTCRFNIPIPGQWFFHVQAKDIAGNLSDIASYPLYIVGGAAERSLIQQVTGDQSAVQTVTWNQPDGSFQIKMPGLGQLLDPKTVALQVAGQNYPCPAGRWNASDETLTIYGISFLPTSPMGLDGETLNATLTARDLQNNPLQALPSLAIQIKSPFNLDQSKQPNLFTVTSATDSDTWRSYWKSTPTPWSDNFESQSNNSLVVFYPVVPQGEKPVKWERSIKPIQESWLYYLENFEDFDQNIVKKEDIEDAPIFDRLCSPLDPSQSKIEGNAPWALAISSYDSPDDDFLRVAIRSRLDGDKVELKRVAKNKLAALIDSEMPGQDIRLDGWLPPSQGRFSLSVPKDRSLRIATTDNPHFHDADSNSISLGDSDDWVRFTVLISPTKGFKSLKGTRLDGIYAW